MRFIPAGKVVPAFDRRWLALVLTRAFRILTRRGQRPYVRDWAERQQFEVATVRTAGGHLRRENLRNNDRVISDDGKLSAELWAGYPMEKPHINVIG